MNYNAQEELRKLDEYYPNSDLSHVYSKHRNEIIRLLETIESVWQKNALDKPSFDVLFDGLQNSWVVVYYYVVGEQIDLMLGKIVGVEELLNKGIEDKNWRTRFNTMVVMKALKDQNIKTKIIESGLRDKSKKVREMAEDVKNGYMNKTIDTAKSNFQKTGRTWLKRLFGTE